MTELSASHISDNVERFTGFADWYDRYRPSVPVVIIDILTQLAHTVRPGLVVDIGSGTGLSTRVWSERAEKVIGIEPSDDMRRRAEQQSATMAQVSYQKGLSNSTGLPDQCADIVTISQALHWMEPIGTLKEVARILRPGGVFAAIDNDWPPTIDLQAEMLDDAFNDHAEQIMAERRYDRDVKKWAKQEHLARITASRHFRYVKEIAVHSVEQGNADRLIGLSLSQGTIRTLLKNGVSEAELGLPELQTAVHDILGDSTYPMYFTYRVRIGVK